jgi:hypothetical protein
LYVTGIGSLVFELAKNSRIKSAPKSSHPLSIGQMLPLLLLTTTSGVPRPAR